MLLYCRPSIRRTINIRSLHITPRRLQRELFDPHNIERVSDNVDVCIVGGGPAGLSAAIRLKQLEQEKGKEIRVVVLEKGAEVGESHCIIFLWTEANVQMLRLGFNCCGSHLRLWAYLFSCDRVSMQRNFLIFSSRALRSSHPKLPAHWRIMSRAVSGLDGLLWLLIQTWWMA